MKVSALDPFRGHATALRTSLPDTTQVFDVFQVTHLCFAAVDDVRRRQQESSGQCGHRDVPLYGIRVLRRAHDNLTEPTSKYLLAALDAGDVDGQIAAAWIAAEDLRLIYQRSGDRRDARQRLHRWLEHCALRRGRESCSSSITKRLRER